MLIRLECMFLSRTKNRCKEPEWSPIREPVTLNDTCLRPTTKPHQAQTNILLIDLSNAEYRGNENVYASLFFKNPISSILGSSKLLQFNCSDIQNFYRLFIYAFLKMT